MRRALPVMSLTLLLAGCQGGTLATPAGAVPPLGSAGHVRNAKLGPVLTTSDGGQIFGFDVNRNGNDGVLASASEGQISVQTFNATTGKITATIGAKTGHKVQKGDDYVADGIFAGDAALLDFQRAGKPGSTPAKDMYRVMNPTSGKKFTGRWKPTIELFNILQWAVNQDTSTSVVYGYEREGSDAPKLVVSNVAANTVSKVIALDPNQFFLSDSPQLAQDTVNNLAVMATSPSGGAAGGPPPVIATVNLSSGKVTEFNGVACPGLAGCGAPNGIAYDSATGVACTTTEIDGGVEFYNVAQQTGFHAFMPGGGQTTAGGYVVNDPVNKLFLIVQPFSGTSQSGSSIQVFNEDGNLAESLNGFDFTDAGFLVIPIRVAINPARRTGWVNGPGVGQLQQFSY